MNPTIGVDLHCDLEPFTKPTTNRLQKWLLELFLPEKADGVCTAAEIAFLAG